MKKDSWHSHLYKTLYNKANFQLPSNLCDYFWAVMFALITLPFWCVTSRDNNLNWLGKIVFGFFTEAMASMILFICSYELIEKLQITSYILAFFMPVIVCLSLCGILIGVGLIAVGIDKACELRKGSAKRKPKSDGLFKTKWKSFKGKYCPKIDWED